MQSRLAWCYKQSQRADFAPRVIYEIQRKGALVVRLHCAGDFYSAEYARQWLEVMRRCPKARFYFYTRSWRVDAIAGVLAQMAALPRCRVWFSVDRDTGVPEHVPDGVRLAYLQVDADEQPERLDLRFVVRTLKRRAQQVSLPSLCPQQAGTSANCGSCGTCFR